MNNRRKQLMLASAKEYCKCVVEGKTLKYNQQVEDNFSNTSVWSSLGNVSYSFNNNVATITTTSSGGANWQFGIQCSFVNGGLKTHKYLVYVEIETNLNVDFVFEILGYYQTIGNNKVVCGIVDVSSVDDQYQYFAIFPSSVLNIGDTYKLSKPTIIDLTELGLDNVNSVADFYETDLGKYILNGNYLPYEPNGAFIHAQSPINFKGVNIWNENWENGIWYYGSKLTSGGYANFVCSKEKMKVYPNTKYFYYCGTGRTNDYIQLEFYDKNGTTISRLIKDNNNYFVTPNNCYSIAFYINDSYGTTYNHDICISENVWNEQWKNGYYASGTKTFVSDYAWICCNQEIKVSPNTRYFAKTNNHYMNIAFFNGDTYISEIAGYDLDFITPNNCNNIVFNLGVSVYDNDIAIFYYGYHKYCNNSVFESGLTLYKGDTYKTYSIDEINYNNAITNAQQDSVNSVTDTKDYLELNVYDLTNYEYIYANQITQNGFYEYVFTAPYGSNNCCINHGGAVENIFFAQNVTIVAGHKYYLSLNVVSCIPSFVGGLRIANLRLIDLTELGLTDLTDKLRIFLQKNYKLPYTLTSKTIKDQIVRTGKEIDLSTLTWESSSPGYRAEAPNDIKLSGNTYFLLFEKYILGYVENQMALNGKVYIQILDATSSPTGKMLYELETPEIITDYPMDFVLSNDNLSYDSSIFGNNGTIFELPNGLIPVLENGIPKLEIIGDEIGFVGIEYGNTPYPAKADVYFVNGFRMSENQIAFTTTNNDGSNVNNYDEREFLVGKTLRVWVTTPRDIPDIMISRRTINVESENEIDLDFTKE